MSDYGYYMPGLTYQSNDFSGCNLPPYDMGMDIAQSENAAAVQTQTTFDAQVPLMSTPFTNAEIEAIEAMGTAGVLTQTPTAPSMDFGAYTSGFGGVGAYGAFPDYDSPVDDFADSVGFNDVYSLGLEQHSGFGAQDALGWSQPVAHLDDFGRSDTLAPGLANQSEYSYEQTGRDLGSLPVSLAYQYSTTLPPTVDLPSPEGAPSTSFVYQPINGAADNIECNELPVPMSDAAAIVEDLENLEGSALKAWSIGSRCTWPKCSSKAGFKTRPSLRTHLKNIHVKPLRCSVPDCTWKAPFGKSSDLKRHKETAHSHERQYTCKVPSCDALVKAFARKDHLVNHMRDRHDNYYCPMNHCPRRTGASFSSPDELAVHIQDSHDDHYECALKSCAQAPSSKFSYEALRNHLRNHHHCGPDGCDPILNMMTDAGARIASIYGNYSIKDCKICAKPDVDGKPGGSSTNPALVEEGLANVG